MFLAIINLEQKLKLPAKLVLHIQYKFVGLQLATMLDKSDKLEMILDLTDYDDAFAALVAEINVDKDEDALNRKAPDLKDDRKCVNFKDPSGLVADANKLHFLGSIGIPVDNIHTLQFLFQ